MIPQYTFPYQIPQTQIPQAQMPQVQAPQVQTQQNGAFIQVPTEQDAYNWAVAPGNCISFKVQNKPLVIEKSMGFSQLESPRIERYRLIKEEVPQEEAQENVESLSARISRLEDEIGALKEKVDRKPVRAKKEENTDA